MPNEKMFDIGARIKLEKDTEFRNAVTGINKSLKSLKSELRLVEAQYDGNANSMEALQKKNEVLSRILEEHKNKVAATGNALKNAKDQYGKIGAELTKALELFDKENGKLEETRKIYGESSEEVKKQEETLRNLELQINKGNKEYEKAGNAIKDWETKLNYANAEAIRAEGALGRNAAYMKEASESADGCAKSIDKFGKANKSAGNEIEELSNVLAAAGVAAKVKDIEKALYACAEASGAFESAVAKVGTIADSSVMPLEEIKNQIMQLSGETGKGVGDLSEAAYQAISAGVDTADTVRFVGNAVKLAAGGFTDEATAVDIMTTAMNAYNLEADQTSRISDVLITTQNLGKTSVANLGSSMGKVIPLAAAYNMQIEDLSTGYALLTANGIATEETTTYLKAALNELGKDGSRVSDILVEKTGKSFAQLLGSGKSLGDVIEILGDSVNGDATAFNNLWSSSEAGIGMLSILNSGTEKYNEVLGKMQDSTGATEAAFEEMSNTSEHAQARMENALNNLKIAIGDELNPALNNMRKAGTDAFEWAAEFVQQNPWIVGAVNGLVAALGALTIGLTALKVIPMVTKMFIAFNAALSANPAILAATAITGLAAAIFTMVPAMKNSTSEADKHEQEVKNLAMAYENLKEKVEESKASFSNDKNEAVAEADAVQVMSNKLYELAESNGVANGKKAEMLAYINQLNEAIPNLNLALDEQTGKLNKTKEVTDSYISSMKQSALEDVYGDRIREIADQIAEANAKIKEAEAEKAELEPLVEEATRKQTEALKENNTTMTAAASGAGGLNAEVSSLKGSYNAAEATIENNKKLIEELEKEQNSLGDEMESTAESMGILTDETESNTQAAKENALAAKDVAASTDTQKEALDSLKEKFEETKQSIRDGLEDKINLFDVFDGGEDLSVDKMAEHMESQLEGVQNYKENLEKLKEAVGTEIAPEFMQYIEDMGLEGANLVANMAEAMDSEDAKAKLKQASDNYMSYLDETDEIAEAGAANKMALDASLGELGSSKADFSALEESVKEAAGSAAAGWNGLTEGTRQALDETIQAAQECGAQIPDGLAEGIQSGEVTPEEAISQLKGSIQGQFDYFSGIAKDAGIQIPDGLETGISQGGDAAVRAMTELYNLILNTQRGSEGASEEAGKKNAQAAGQGIEKASPEVSQKTGEVMKQAASTANSYGGSFTSVGYNMMSGVAIGLNSGSGLVYNKIQQILDEAKRRANKVNDSHSPSRVWRDQVGLYMAQGLAQGVDKGKKDVVDAVTGMADESLKAAKDELGIRSPSKTFRDQVGAQISEGTALGIKLKKKKSKKAAKEMAQEVAQAAEEAYEDYRKNNVSKINATLDDEQYMWEQLIKTAKKGGKTYRKEIKKLAKEHLEEIRQQRKAERLDAQETALDAYKTYYAVSPKAEMQYWDAARRKYKEGTDQRLEADKKYYEAKENYYEKLEDLEGEYYEKCQDVKDKLQDDIDELKESYNQAFDERRSAIKDAFGLFDEFASESETPEKLLANMQSQVQGYALWMEQLSELEGKNILDSDFLSELREMGPDAAATILSLNMMTDEQLHLANEAYEEKNRLAEAQAARETEALRKETEDKIKAASAAAQKELDAYKKEYDAAWKEINQDISGNLQKLAKNAYKSGVDAVAGLIKGITDKAATKNTDKQLKGVQKEIAGGLDGLPVKGKAIGKDTLAGILKGISNSLEIKKGAKSFVKELEDAIRKEADMHSPSKRFEKLSLDFPAGAAKGIEKGTPAAVTASTDMVRAMLDKSKEALQKQQAALREYLVDINGGAGIAALNNLAAQQALWQPSVTVNNSGAAEMIAGLMTEVKGLREEVKHMGLYLDGDLLVGGIGDRMGEELAATAFRIR